MGDECAGRTLEVREVGREVVLVTPRDLRRCILLATFSTSSFTSASSSSSARARRDCWRRNCSAASSILSFDTSTTVSKGGLAAT